MSIFYLISLTDCFVRLTDRCVIQTETVHRSAMRLKQNVQTSRPQLLLRYRQSNTLKQTEKYG